MNSATKSLAITSVLNLIVNISSTPSSFSEKSWQKKVINCNRKKTNFANPVIDIRLISLGFQLDGIGNGEIGTELVHVFSSHDYSVFARISVFEDLKTWLQFENYNKPTLISPNPLSLFSFNSLSNRNSLARAVNRT